MGVAILSGVIASLDSSRDTLYFKPPKWESHTPGTVTPAVPQEDDSQPSKFLACVTREEGEVRLKGIFSQLGGLGRSVQVFAGENVKAAQQADVVLLWCVSPGRYL